MHRIRYLEKICQFGVPEWYMVFPFCQSKYDVTQRGQAFINGLSNKIQKHTVCENPSYLTNQEMQNS